MPGEWSLGEGLMRAITGAALLSCLVLGGWGCGPRRTDSDASECSPVETRLDATASAEGLAGQYRLTLAATIGDREGQVVNGQLWLREQERALKQMPMGGQDPDLNVSMPLIGATDANVDQVGALRLGDLMSLDPEQPGVAVIEQHGRAEESDFARIILRLGSAANRRDVQAFDGGFTALYVHWLSADGFGGTWASGLVGRESQGYFCALKVNE